MRGSGRTIITAILLVPSLCGSGEYSDIHQADAVIVNHGGNIHVRQQPEIVGRLAIYLAGKGDMDNINLAEELAATSHPKALAAIAQVESGFNSKSRGKDGERGAWQVRPELWGNIPGDIVGQMKQAEVILEELIRQEGSLTKAIRRYNGSGPQSRKYQAKVLKTIKEI